MSEASFTTVTKKEKRSGGWNQRVKRRPREVTVLWNEAQGVSVNLEGERHEQTQAKSTRRERDDQANMERKEDRNVLGEVGEEIKSSKR